MKLFNYIVPIFCEDCLNGTGFIVGNTLITAAHVVISKSNDCSFVYEGEYYCFGPDNNLFYEYPEEKSKQGQNSIYRDLAIYKLDDIDSALELHALDIDTPCVYQGYSDSATQMDIYDNIKLDGKDWYYPLGEKKPICINNTFISIGGKCKGGNSGGPLFQGNYVVGMLVGNQQYQSFSLDRYIRSDYLIEKLSIK